jgi:hypothetical protein
MRNNELIQNNDGRVAETPRFLYGDQIRKAEINDQRRDKT